jgi:hypothetical protein
MPPSNVPKNTKKRRKDAIQKIEKAAGCLLSRADFHESRKYCFMLIEDKQCCNQVTSRITAAVPFEPTVPEGCWVSTPHIVLIS